MAWARKESKSVVDPATGEKLVMRFPTQWIAANNVDNVILKSDCQLVTLQLKKGLAFPDDISCPIIEHLLTLLAPTGVVVSFITREANNDVHVLSKGCVTFPE